jgi:hypothetical protein
VQVRSFGNGTCMPRHVKCITIAASILGLTLLGMAGGYASGKWKSSRPIQENFDKAVRAIWERNNRLRAGKAFGEPANRLCISVPMHPAPDARSRAQLPSYCLPEVRSGKAFVYAFVRALSPAFKCRWQLWNQIPMLT